MVLAMPNTQPPIFDAATLDIALGAAYQKAHCDYAQYLRAGPHNADIVPALAHNAAGLKMYLDSTFGELRLDDMTLWKPHFENYPREYPIVVHAESRSMAAAMFFSAMYDRSVHIAHISLKEEVLLIKAAKKRGIKVTCEVCPHHLFLTSPFHEGEGSGVRAESTSPIGRGVRGEGRLEVRPRLATQKDINALWENLDVIDCFATDHAPHTIEEKDSANPPPAFPGLETALPLLLTAVDLRRLPLDELIQNMYSHSRNLSDLPEHTEAGVEVGEDAEYEIHAAEMFPRCGQPAYEG